jgi:Lipocalin-like domain
MKPHRGLAIIFLLLAISCTNRQTVTIENIRGMYQLDKFESLDQESGNWIPEPSRIGWSGYILYDGLGHMGVHLMPKGYQDFDASKNIDSLNQPQLKELAEFYGSNFVYFADYSIRDTVIEHKRLSTTDPKDRGTVLVRNVEFRGDTLILTPHEKISGQQLRLRWVKMK